MFECVNILKPRAVAGAAKMGMLRAGAARKWGDSSVYCTMDKGGTALSTAPWIKGGQLCLLHHG